MRRHTILDGPRSDQSEIWSQSTCSPFSPYWSLGGHLVFGYHLHRNGRREAPTLQCANPSFDFSFSASGAPHARYFHDSYSPSASLHWTRYVNSLTSAFLWMVNLRSLVCCLKRFLGFVSCEKSRKSSFCVPFAQSIFIFLKKVSFLLIFSTPGSKLRRNWIERRTSAHWSKRPKWKSSRFDVFPFFATFYSSEFCFIVFFFFVSWFRLEVVLLPWASVKMNQKAVTW